MIKRNIHNLDTLGRELDRLRAEAKNMEASMDEKIEDLHSNLGSLIVNSLFSGKDQQASKNQGFRSGIKNEAVNVFISKIIDRFSERAIDGIENFFEKLFPGQKQGNAAG